MFRSNHIKSFSRSKACNVKPNMALTVRQINERFVQGKPVPPSKTPIIEPAIINGVNPLRHKYVDYTDLFAYGEMLSTKLNEQTALLTEKQKELMKLQDEYNRELYNQFKPKKVNNTD